MAAGTLKFQQNQATIVWSQIFQKLLVHTSIIGLSAFAGCSAWIRLAAASGCLAPSGAGTGD